MCYFNANIYNNPYLSYYPICCVRLSVSVLVSFCVKYFSYLINLFFRVFIRWFSIFHIFLNCRFFELFCMPNCCRLSFSIQKNMLQAHPIPYKDDNIQVCSEHRTDYPILLRRSFRNPWEPLPQHRTSRAFFEQHI